jgi:hypothetical protein
MPNKSKKNKNKNVIEIVNNNDNNNNEIDIKLLNNKVLKQQKINYEINVNKFLKCDGFVSLSC